MSREVLQQVKNLVAEGHLEVAPSLRHRIGDLEGERLVACETSSVCDGARRRVVSVALGDALGVDEQAQEAPAVAAGVEDPAPGQVGPDGVEHGFPYETVLVLHGLVLCGATPVGATHASTLRRGYIGCDRS